MSLTRLFTVLRMASILWPLSGLIAWQSRQSE